MSSRSALKSSSLPLASCDKDQIAIKLMSTTLRCFCKMNRVGSRLKNCATRVVSKHVNSSIGNTPFKVTLIQPAYRPSEISAFSVVFIKFDSAMSCLFLHGVARSFAVTTRFCLIILRPQTLYAFCNCCITLDGVTKHAKLHLSISSQTLFFSKSNESNQCQN